MKILKSLILSCRACPLSFCPFKSFVTHSSTSAFPQTLFCLELSSTSWGGDGWEACHPSLQNPNAQSNHWMEWDVCGRFQWIPPSRHHEAYCLLLKGASTLQPFHWSFLLNNKDCLGNEGRRDSTAQRPMWCHNSSHVRGRSSYPSCQTWLLSVKGCLLWNRGGLLGPSSRPWAPARTHSAELYTSFSQSSDSQGHQNRSDVGIFHTAYHQLQFFFSSIQSLSFLLEVVTNRQ